MMSGCSGPIPFTTLPLENVIIWKDGAIYELSGELVLNTDKTSTFAVQSDDGKIVCSGSADGRGQGANVCTGGLTFAFNVPADKFGKFNASYVDSKPDYRVAVGWGDEADAKKLRALLGL